MDKIKDTAVREPKNISEFIQERREDICDNNCEYRDTAGDEFLGDIFWDGGGWPLGAVCWGGGWGVFGGKF